METVAISTELTGSRITVLCIKDTWLDAERFDFYYSSDRHEFRFEKWLRLNKPTKRHKYQIIELWDWRDRRSIKQVESPPLPSDEVMQAVKDKFVEMVTFNLETAK